MVEKVRMKVINLFSFSFQDVNLDDEDLLS